MGTRKSPGNHQRGAHLRGRNRVRLTHHLTEPPQLDPRKRGLTARDRMMLRFEINVAKETPPIPINCHAAVMCPHCGHTGRHNKARGPITGICKAQKACAKRREELDDTTIAYFHLKPRVETLDTQGVQCE